MQCRSIFLSRRLIIRFLVGGLAIALCSKAVNARINVVVVHNDSRAATSDFRFRFVPQPAADDAAAKATVSVVDGRRDENGGDVVKLQDGQVPADPDQPSENFFFSAGTSGGRLLVDLGNSIAIDQVNTYSWHPSSRGPQVYSLFASDGADAGFDRLPQQGADPAQAGWKLLTDVDTRPKEGEGEAGGQYGVSIFDSDGPLGNYRYLLFDIARTQNADPFGNTFYSEIDVVGSATRNVAERGTTRPHVLTIGTGDAAYEVTIDTSQVPDLTDWAQQELAPVVEQWYPKIVQLLPSEGFQAPRFFSITFSPRMRGVAATGGTRIRCSADWFRRNLQGEAKGAIVHELVHVVQQYGNARRNNPGATRPPGWLVEGIADYIRWFLYEPQSRGAEITPRNLSRAQYDGSYRVSGNFLNWVTQQHDADIVPKLNAALRNGQYERDLWKLYTGRTVEELGDQWKSNLERTLAVEVNEDSSSGETDSSEPVGEPSDATRAAGAIE